MLKDYNAFRIDAACKDLVHVFTVEDALPHIGKDVKIIGGGSNILLTGDVDATILLNKIKGFEIIEENQEYVIVKVGGGEIWHNFVMWSVSHNLGGIENLALIPGSVGAAPVQNIGAYGVEQCDTFVNCNVIDLDSGAQLTIDKPDAKFGYRESVFKNEYKGKYLITDVTYRLSKRPILNISYGAIQEKLEQQGITDPSVKEVTDTIISIRQSKLPDPNVIYNAGSFFKNPVVYADTFQQIKSKYPTVKYYEVGDQYKIPAAWLIENAGLKGYAQGDAGVYENHALVLVNKGSASGKQMLDIAQRVIDTVSAEYGIVLTPEVNIW